MFVAQWISVPTASAQPSKGQTGNGQTQHHEKSESGVYKGKCRQGPVRLLLLTANNCISSLESHCGFLTPDSSKAQKLSIFKVEKILYEPTMTMFHCSSSQVPPFLTLGNNMNILVDNLPVKHHSLPARRKEARVTMFL